MFSNLINDYNRNGYVKLGKICTNSELKKLNKRVKDLMLGKVKYKNMFFQKDSNDGKYININKKSEIFLGPSLRYRKIKDLEYDNLFHKIFRKKILKYLSMHLIGRNVSCMRAMILNKPKKNSSVLPYHQDVSKNWNMTIKPKFTFWLSLNGANKKNGCLSILRGSHKKGILNKGHLININSKNLKKLKTIM